MKVVFADWALKAVLLYYIVARLRSRVSEPHEPSSTSGA